MNKWLTVLGIGSAVLLSQQVQALPFTVNGLPFPGMAVGPLTVNAGATQQATMTSTLTGGQNGTLTSKVFSGDANNTLGGLTFTYLLNITSGEVDIFTLTGWTPGAAIIAGQNGAGQASTGVDSPGSGVINFFFSALTGTSETLVVETSATTFTPVTELFQDGAQAHALGFGVVPDGGMTVMLLGMALSGLALFRKKVMA